MLSKGGKGSIISQKEGLADACSGAAIWFAIKFGAGQKDELD
jgi:hypothetical protein